MSEKRPNVFPSQKLPEKNENNEQEKISIDYDYEQKRVEIAQEVYQNSMGETGMSSAIDEMRKRTEEQMRLRDEMLRKNEQKTQEYQEKFNYASDRHLQQPQQTVKQEEVKEPIYKEIKSPVNKINMETVTQQNDYIQQLSQPQFNTAFDVIPLPSQGKLYKNKKTSVRIAYLTAADENILTSPNLLQSGEFLEILINRKLLEPDLRYRDLNIGDRNAIMIWLRATGYGEMYPVTILDENDVPFDTEVNLNELKIKNLNVEPDDEGLFTFQLPVSKTILKFKLLNVGEVEDIEKLLEKEKQDNLPINNSLTYTLEKQIVEVNGNRDKLAIREFVQNMRLGDSKELRKYIDSIDCGIDLRIEVGTPGGGSVKTFLPLNTSFFWPDFSI